MGRHARQTHLIRIGRIQIADDHTLALNPSVILINPTEKDLPEFVAEVVATLPEIQRDFLIY